MSTTRDISPLLLDESAMRDVFQHELPGYEAVRVRSCRIHQTRRRISRKIRDVGSPYLGVVYTLELATRDGHALTQWLYARAYTGDASAVALQDARIGAMCCPRVGTALTRLGRLDTLVWTLPNDPALPHLPQFLDAAAVRDSLGSAWGLNAACPEDFRVATPQIVRHEPEEHCTARFEVQLRGRRRFCYGKSYAGSTWQVVAMRIDSLRAVGESDRNAFAIARPLGTSAALHAVWQEEEPGVPLRQALSGTRAEAWIAQVAVALARLHAMPLLGNASLTPRALLERAFKQRKKMAQADADLAPALDAVLEGLQRTFPGLTRRVTIHGDFHAGQMLCGGERLVLFDFEDMAEGSPAHDVADFVSQLLTDAAFDPNRATALARQFVDHYLKHAGHPLSRSELDWYLRLLYLRQAYRFLVRHRSGWRERVLHSAALATRGLDGLSGSPVGV